MNWTEKRYNVLLAMRALLTDLYGAEIPSPILSFLQRIEVIASEGEFERFTSFQSMCFKECFEKVTRFETV